MRLLLASLSFLPLPALAERYEIPARVTDVTVFGMGAEINRTLTLDLAAGRHEILVPGMNAELHPEFLRVTMPEGLRFISSRLFQRRQPVTEDVKPPQIKSAEDLLEQREDELRAGQREVELLRLTAEAAEAQADYLRRIGSDGARGLTDPDQLRAMGEAIRSEIAAARRAAKTASFAAEDAERDLKDKKDAAQKAKLALEALTPATEVEHKTLILDVEAQAAGTFTVKLHDFAFDAGWRPAYNLHLTRQPEPRLRIDRSVVVEQGVGEDWLGVQLTLSTAQPSDQSRASTIHPERRNIFEITPPSSDAAAKAGDEQVIYEPPVIIHEESYRGVDFAGANVTYRFDDLVDLRSWGGDLGLDLGSLTLTPEITAVAAPLHDQTAFVTALIRNSSSELLLPGSAMLWLEGQLVGSDELPLMPSGAQTEIGFGQLHGMTLNRITPERSSGSAGLIGRAYQLNEQVQIEVENLTAEAWPLRLIDRVPYSEQDQLRVTWTATPTPSTADKDGKRGVLEWQLTLEPGAKQQIQLDWRLDWPSSYMLR